MTEPKSQSQSQSPKQRDQGGFERSSAQGEPEGILEQAKGIATQVADKAKSNVGSKLSERTSKSAIELSELADALRHTSKRLEGNVAAPLIDNAANRLERFSDVLDTADVRQVIRDVEDFARREPLLFLGGALVAGILGARFLRSGSGSATTTSPPAVGDAQISRDIPARPTPARARNARASEGRRLTS